MWEAMALVCFLTAKGPACVTWSDNANPYPTFEACDRATDEWLEKTDEIFTGFGVVQIHAGCLKSGDET